MKLPKITLVTPTLNQARLLEECIRSVVWQNYPDLEYIVVDGGSTDDTIHIIKKYEDRLAWWVSEPDEGPYHAINKAFERATGEVMGWLGSDDLHLPWTLHMVGTVFAQFPQVEWISSLIPLMYYSEGEGVGWYWRFDGFGRRRFFRGMYMSYRGVPASIRQPYIQQESTFWRRSLWERAGACLNTAFRYAADFELWCRFWKHSRLVGVAFPLACFRSRADQRSKKFREEYEREALTALVLHGGRVPGRFFAQVLGILGRLNKMGLVRPRRLALYLGLAEKVYNIERAFTGVGVKWRLVEYVL